MAKPATASNLHIVMLPWSAFGHLIPFHQLSISLAKKGAHISYVSTPNNIQRLPKITPNLAPLLQYVSLELPSVPGSDLPPGEATVDMEFDQIQYLKAAYDLLHEPFKQFVLANSPDWIISEFAAHWLPQLVQGCQLQLMYFSVYSACALAFFGPPEYLTGEGQRRVRGIPDSMTAPPQWGAGIFPSTVAYRGYEAAVFHSGLYGSNASGVTDGERLAKMFRGCQAVAIRTCREFEGEFIDVYQSLIHKPVVPAGVLPPPPLEIKEKMNKTSDENWSEVFKWLDNQSSRSVIYVGFGSEYKLTKDEVYEIAYGLELANLPFIWALRKPTWVNDDSEALPPGFETRTLGKEIVCLGWAPQLEILGHPSVGGSLFHSGWGSIIESLNHGHNLILLPFIIDQGLNARLMVDKGLGVEVERREDGTYTRHDIANALRKAMIGDEAEVISDRTRQAAEVFGDHELQEEHYIGKLVEFLRNEAWSYTLSLSR